MIHFFYGSDVKMARQKARETISELQKKDSCSEVIRYTIENFNTSLLDEHISNQSLFGHIGIIFLDNILNDEKISETIIKKVAEINDSKNYFIILEEKCIKSVLIEITKHSKKSKEFVAPKKIEKEHSAFALADALGKRDKKTFWVLMRKSLDSGSSVEQIHGMLFWKVKSMILGKDRSAKNFSKKELAQLSSRLVSMYHDSHRGIHKFETELEKFSLTI